MATLLPTTPGRRRFRRGPALFVFAFLAFSMMAVARADDAPEAPQISQPQRPRHKNPEQRANTVALPRVRRPPSSTACRRNSTTKQTLALPGRTLAFSATAGSIRLFNDKGEPQADIAYTAYQLDGADPATRPVTFCSMAGRARPRPSCNSAMPDRGGWHRCRRAVSSASPDLLPNAETWLDFTDLVFIDPVGTGYSRFVATGEDVRKRFFSVDGDVNSIALMIRRWLEKIRSPAVAQIRRRRKLWRHPRAEDRAQSADPAGRRREGSDPGLAGARLPRITRAPA